jgi:FkbM family methyltransferase
LSGTGPLKCELQGSSVKRKGVRKRFLVLLGLVVTGGIFLVHPTLRTKGFFLLSRTYIAHCSSENAKLWPGIVAPIFEPFVPVWVRIEPGVTMWLDPYDVISREILITGQWEPQTWHVLEPHVPVGGTFVDVGAHIGWYSLKAAKAVGSKGRVIAIEPDQATLRKLRDNIHASGGGAVIVVVPVACYDSETTLPFYSAPRTNTGESSLSVANASQEGPAAASYQVRARRLDDVLQEVGVTRVDAVKIDVEGAELRVLKGAVETLDRYRPEMSVEVSEEGLKSMGASVREVKAFMRSHGYAPKQVTESNVEFVPVSTP